MPVRDADPPPDWLCRVGWQPDPLAWPDWAYVGNGRFDDPRDQFRALYACEHRRTCFVETLAQYRPSLALLAAKRGIALGDRGDDSVPVGQVPEDWLVNRRIGRLRLTPGRRWLDLRPLETHEALRHTLTDLLLDLGYQDFTMSDALGRDRHLTRAIARWAYDRGYQGLQYRSRFGHTDDCWAIFEGTPITRGEIAEIATDDADFRTVIAIFRLRFDRE